jgi:hypothetical protein
MVSSILLESSGTEDSEWHRDTVCEPSKRNDKEVKTRQSRRIRELGDALNTEGYVTRPASQDAWARSNHGLDHTQR